MKLIRSSFFAAALFMSFTARACARDSQIVCVLIAGAARAVNVSSDGILKIADMKTGRVSTLRGGNSFQVLPAGFGLEVRSMAFSSMARLIADKKFIRINGRSYRGTVILKNEKGRVSAVNELGVEDYLCGVLPKEVSPKWKGDALKAQAVVSRTYILRNLGRFSDKGYDLTSCDNSQVYGGAGVEKPETTRAVKETTGQILVYRGSPAYVYFHADAAGYTEDPKYVWGTKTTPRYLRGRREPFRDSSPYASWKYTISYEKLVKLLKKKGYALRRVRRVVRRGRDRSGRTIKFRIYTDRGKLEIPSNKFRVMVGASGLRSTKIKRIKNDGRTITFEGSGWGHGVGMSQWGAKELADKGWIYKKILKFYFPGTKLSRVRD